MEGCELLHYYQARESTYLSVGPTQGKSSGNHVTHRKILAQLISMGWPDSGKLWWSTFGLVAVSDFIVAMRTRASGLMNMHNYLYCPPVFRAVSGDFKIQNSLLHVQKHPVDKNCPPMIKFTNKFSFCPNYIAKSVRNFSKTYGVSREHQQRFAHHIFQLRASSCTDIRSSGTQPAITPEVSRVRYLLSLSIGIPFSLFMQNAEGNAYGNQPITIKSISHLEVHFIFQIQLTLLKPFILK